MVAKPGGNLETRANFVLLAGGVLRIELHQTEDNRLSGSQTQSAAAVSRPPIGPPQSTAWNSPEQPVSTFSDSQKEPCGVEPS